MHRLTPIMVHRPQTEIGIRRMKSPKLLLVPSASRIPRTSRLALAACLATASLPTVATGALAAPQPRLNPQGSIEAPARTQISFKHTPTGFHVGTVNENEARPGLSIVKLYIADYVFKHGSPQDKAKATQMIRVSDDAIASELYGSYPDSINATAREYGLTNTQGAAHWGDSTTSSRDTANFLAAKKRENPVDPVLLAMKTSSPVAADGYAQDYGTGTLPGTTGTKWGWSDDRNSVHASASIGPDFTVAANTYGPKDAHTADVQGAFDAPAFGLPGLPDLPTPGDWSPSLPQSPSLPNISEFLPLN